MGGVWLGPGERSIFPRFLNGFTIYMGAVASLAAANCGAGSVAIFSKALASPRITGQPAARHPRVLPPAGHGEIEQLRHQRARIGGHHSKDEKDGLGLSAARLSEE